VPDDNGSDLTQRVETLEKARKDIEDSLVVMAHLENEMSQLFKQQAKNVASHEQRLKDVDDYMAGWEKRMRKQEEFSGALDKRIDKLVSGIGELISRIPTNSLRTHAASASKKSAAMPKRPSAWRATKKRPPSK
jgi:predicted  nucleic acid-binding Zn-ribbon protein